jgi:hypothetical protein
LVLRWVATAAVLLGVAAVRFGTALDDVAVADAEAVWADFFRDLVGLAFSATSFNR